MRPEVYRQREEVSAANLTKGKSQGHGLLMANQPISLAVCVSSVRAMLGGDLIFYYSGSPLLENERNLQQLLETPPFKIISRIFPPDVAPGPSHSSVPWAWPSSLEANNWNLWAFEQKVPIKCK